MRSRLLCFGIALLLCQSVTADEDWHTWGAVIASGHPSESMPNLAFWLEGQGRFNDDTSRFNQGILRTALGYRLSERAVVYGGYGYIPNNPPNNPDNVVEHRLYQQLSFGTVQLPFNVSMSSRTRLEQRTIEGADDTGWRFRQFLKWTRPTGFHDKLYWSVWDEIFINLDDTDWGANDGIDQNRVFAGMGVHVTPKARAEVGYMNQLVRRTGRSDASNHILSLTLLLKF